MGQYYQEIITDVLILGAEAAGAKAAIDARESGANVTVVTKGLMGRSGDTVMAGRGIQVPLGHMDPRDNPEVFFQDVIRGGAFLNNQKLVEKLANLAVTEVPKLDSWGAKFKKIGDKFFQYKPPGATYPRSLEPIGPAGQQYRKAFATQFKRLGIQVLQDCFITNLLLSYGQVAGAFGISLRDGQYILLRAKNVILATGGCPQMFLKTDSSRDATGDGMSMAFNAGAEMMDMEFQQFFPYCCYTPPCEMDLFPTGMRYFLNARFYNRLGEQFMERYFPIAKEWGLRDPTSRAIYLENKLGRGSPHGGAYLSVRHLPRNLIDNWLKERPQFSPMYKMLNLDIHDDAVECGPGAHYSMGGIRVNENCETTLPRLYAVGEVASGMDGAERIDGGPAITWCLTMGYIAGKEAAGAARELDLPKIDPDQVNVELARITSLRTRQEGIKGLEVKQKIKNIMWEYCSLVRDEKGLEEALRLIKQVKSEDLPALYVPDSSQIYNRSLMEAFEAINMADLAEIIIGAAYRRKESRRSHYRTDYPVMDNHNWLKNTIIKKENEKVLFTTADPNITKMQFSETEVLEG